AAVSDEFVAPGTTTERRVASVWSQVLDVEEVGINDNFFALGGHSLLAMQVMSRIRDELGVALTLRAIFDAPTVRELAEKIEALDGAPPAPTAPALVRVDRTRLRSVGVQKR